MKLETERLFMRQWRQDDFEIYAAYYESEKTARFVGGQMDRNKAWRHMAAIAGHWLLKGYGLWAVEEKTSGSLIGCIGLWKPEGWPELEVGYWLTENAHGKGYATEAAIKARDYAYEFLDVNTVVSYIDPDNQASIAVAERMGAKFDGIIELLDLGRYCVYRHNKFIECHQSNTV